MQWTAVILCAATIAINYLDRSTIAIANPQIRAEFHMSAAQFGALQSAWSLAYALAQIPVGLLIDRLGPGILLGISMILWSIAVAAGGLVANYTRLFIARAVLGVTESPAYPMAVRVISDWFHVRDRGVPTGVFNMGSNIGIAIGPPLLTALMLLAGWRWMFIIMGIIGIGASVLWFWHYRDPGKAALSSTDIAYLETNKSRRSGAPITAGQFVVAGQIHSWAYRAGDRKKPWGERTFWASDPFGNRGALANLSESQRETLRCAFFEGYSLRRVRPEDRDRPASTEFLQSDSVAAKLTARRAPVRSTHLRGGVPSSENAAPLLTDGPVLRCRRQRCG
jgi:MFS family permease